MNQEKFILEVSYLELILLRTALDNYKPSGIFHTEEEKSELTQYLKSI